MVYIYDFIHGYMEFKTDEKKYIDNRWLKRLKRIKQLGLLEQVFPSASHNRFEHSLGVSYLANKYINILDDTSAHFRPSDMEKLCVKLSGLFHDVGHGPFSHIYDDLYFAKNFCHEKRSCQIVEWIFKEVGTSKYIKSAYIIDTVKEMISPSSVRTDPLYNIVNNDITKIDVDKFDYLARDSKHMGLSNNVDYERIFIKSNVCRGEIIYDYSVVNNILDLYMTRYRYHKEIYNHTTVKLIELMLKDALKEADKVFDFLDWSSTDKFISLDDSIYSTIINSDNKDLRKSKQILERIEKRDLYKLVWIGNEDDCDDTHILNDNKQIKLKFDLCNGDKYPLEKVKFTKNDVIEYGDKLNINTLFPSIYQNEMVLIYSI